MIRKDPHDWEALYRQGLALADLDKPDEAARRFQAMLDLAIGDDEKSAAAKARSRDPKLQAAGARPSALDRQAMLPLEDADRHDLPDPRRPASSKTAKSYSSRMGPVAVWAPADFGQARMAALGWLVSLAEKTGAAKSDEVVAEFRKASEKTPADVRALWDWFYLCLLRYDNAAASSAGKTCRRAAADRPAGPLGLSVFAGRPPARAGRQRDLRRPGHRSRRTARRRSRRPSSITSWPASRSLRARRPELAQAQILQNVANELKRAKRVDEEERFYREAIAGATQLAQIAGSSAWRPNAATSTA